VNTELVCRPEPRTVADTRPGPTAKRLLVAWFRYSVNGGIGRFLNVARVLNGFGHDVAFTSLTDETEPDWPDFPGPVLTFAEAQARTWDAVMVPGAGATDQQLALLARLRADSFGVRIQHILNDPSLRERFAVANSALAPDVVIFNNSHWRDRDYRQMAAAAFHVLPGAVDTDLFFPAPLKDAPCRPPRWAVGGFATKNPQPLLAAAELFPADHVLHLYGVLPAEARPQAEALARTGRLVNHGPLFGADLAAFYHGLDLVVTCETRAGWCNTAAEAMACGLPCVVTPPGTVDFARDGETALVLDRCDAERIAGAVGRLVDDPGLRRDLARSGARTMRDFSWPAYCQKLLTLVEPPEINSYYRLPELGLFGKWDPTVRVNGLDSLLARCEGASVLDLGAAEGVVGLEFASRGAGPIHGFELDPDRVSFARSLFVRAGLDRASFRTADLADWPEFVRRNADLLQDDYDIVLFLGLYHHLPATTRRQSLAAALQRARRWFVIRTPETLRRTENVVGTITAHGFTLIEEHRASEAENAGWLGLFRREGAA